MAARRWTTSSNENPDRAARRPTRSAHQQIDLDRRTTPPYCPEAEYRTGPARRAWSIIAQKTVGWTDKITGHAVDAAERTKPAPPHGIRVWRVKAPTKRCYRLTS